MAPKVKSVPVTSEDRWLIDLEELARRTSLSKRHLRRLDADRAIPGRVTCGRRVLFLMDAVQRWLRDGMPTR